MTETTIRQRLEVSDQAVSRLWMAGALLLVVNNDHEIPSGSIMIGCGCDEPEYGEVDLWERYFVPSKADPADMKLAASTPEYFINRTVGSSAHIREEVTKALSPFFE